MDSMWYLLRIECFDISNIQGSEVVASMVVFEDGLPRKSEYRRFVDAARTVDRPERRRRHAPVIARPARQLIDDRVPGRVRTGTGEDAGARC